MSERKPMTDIERDIAERCMDGDRAGLRRSIATLSGLDSRLCELTRRQVLTESVATLLEAGAQPTPHTITYAIRHGHVDALREMLKYISLDGEYRCFVVPELRGALSKTWGTQTLELLLDAGIEPSQELARAAAAGQNSDALRLLRERGLTEDELIQGVCAK